MALKISQLQRKLVLAKVTDANAFRTTLAKLQPGDTIPFKYKSSSKGAVQEFKAKVETGSVTFSKQGKLVTQKKTYLTDVNNPASKIDLDEVFGFAGLNMKVDVDGIPQLNVEDAARAGDDIEAVAVDEGVDPAQAKSMKQAFLEYFNNNPFKKFVDRFRASRRVADNVRPPNEQARVKAEEVKVESEVDAASISRRAAIDEPLAVEVKQVAEDASDAAKVEQKLDELKSDPEAKAPIDNNPVLESVNTPLERIFVESILEPPGPSVRKGLRTKWQEWRNRPPNERRAAEAVATPAPVEEKAIVQMVEKELPERANKARSENKISTEVQKQLTDAPKSSSWTKREKIAAGAVAGTLLVGGSVVGAMAWYRARASMAGAVAQHQQDLNGCWMYNKLDGTKTKVKLLSCGDLDLTSAMETCSTQSFVTGSTSISDCPNTTFNPCTRNSKNRSTNSQIPLVPNVCDTYVSSGSPAAIEGVTTIPACRKLDGSALPSKQSCSPYCQTENFNLPPHLALMCIDVDFSTAFVDLVSALGYDPQTIFPPANAQLVPPSGPSKAVWIALAVIGVALLIGLGVYWFKN